MRVLSITITIFVSLILTSHLYGQVTYQKVHSRFGADVGTSIQSIFDGGYIITGQTTSFGMGFYDVLLVNIDSIGDSVWTKVYGGVGFDAGYSVQQTKDKGFIIAGETQSFGAGNADVYLVKTYLNGDTMWTRAFGGLFNDIGYSVIQTKDQGFLVAGYTASFGAGNSDIYLIKTTPQGDTSWTKTFGGANQDICRSIQEAKVDGYVLVGETRSFGAGGSDVQLIKVDSNGAMIWNKVYGGALDDMGKVVQLTKDGGYIIAGETQSFGAGMYDLYLIKTDAAGDTAWTKTYGGSNNEYCHSLIQTSDGGYLLQGETYSFGGGTVDAYLLKLNATGDTLWTKTYGGIVDDVGRSVVETQDKGFIVIGTTQNFGAFLDDIYLIRTDQVGNSGCNQYNTNTEVATPSTSVGSSIMIPSRGAFIDTPWTATGFAPFLTQVQCFACDTPIANFIYTDSQLTVNFTDSSIFALSYRWDFGDGDTSDLKTPSHAFDSSGTYNVCLIVTNNCDSNEYCTLVTVEFVNGIGELQPFSTTLMAYPNPYRSITTISYYLPESDLVELSVYDIVGNRISLIVNEEQQKGGYSYHFSASQLGYPSGIYFLSLKTGTSIVSKKLIEVW